MNQNDSFAKRMMGARGGRHHYAKSVIIAILIILISAMHYVAGYGQPFYHAFFREFYFIPLILAGLWFGLRGAVLASGSVTVFYLPFVLLNWHGSAVDFERVMSIVLFNIIAAILGLTSDRQTAMERALRESEHLSAMGRAVSAAAHDIRTPLVAIEGFVRLARKALKENDPAREKLNTAIRETERLGNMVNEMLDFSRPLSLNLIRADFGLLAGEVIAVLAGEAERRNVTIDLNLPEGLPKVLLDTERVKQAFINLLANALEVSPEGEHVTLEISAREGFVICDIIDHGSGISPENRPEIFAPFFTTKVGGTGLGLPIARKIVEAHGGRITILSGAKNGTVFRVAFPRSIKPSV